MSALEIKVRSFKCPVAEAKKKTMEKNPWGKDKRENTKKEKNKGGNHAP